MLEQDNIWKDKFNEPSLEDQAWLEPDAAVLDSIMKEIRQKPKRRGLIWFFLFFALALGIMTAFILGSEKNSEFNSGLPLTQTRQLIESEEPITDSFIDSASGTLAVNEKGQRQASMSNDSPKVKAGYIVSKLAPVGKKSKNNVKQAETALAAVPLAGNTAPTGPSIPDNPPLQTQRTSLNTLASLKTLPTGLKYPDVQAREITSPVLNPTPIDPITQQEKIYLSVVAGVSVWNFNLNNNYNTALSPADFRHDSGVSKHFGFEFGYALTPRMNFTASFGLEQVVFHSGHNSSLTYNSLDEVNNDPSNHYNLTMATPVGFMASDIVVQRSSQSALPPTDFIIDLNSTHRISNIDLGIGLSYAVWQSSLFNLHTDVTVGLNNFSQVSNTLENFTVNHTALSYADGHVSRGQDRVRHTTGYAGIGVRLVRQLSDSHLIALQCAYKANLEPIYRENDFSTDLGRLQFGFQFARKF